MLFACPLHAGWRESLTPDHPGPIPQVRPFDAEFRFGWSNIIEAARAHTSLTYAGDEVMISARGGTSGPARILWQMDVTHEAHTRRAGLATIWVDQIEKYAKHTIITQIVSKPDAIWRLRQNGPVPAKWKKIKISPLRDLFSGMLFIRSQRLDPGDEVSTIIFPGDAPFLVEMKVLGTESISIAGTSRDAIKLDIRLHRINLKKGGALEDHGKFRSGTVWLSNDADRIPLRAEVQIFIGYVFAELVSCKFTTP